MDVEMLKENAIVPKETEDYTALIVECKVDTQHLQGQATGDLHTF